MKLIRMTLGLTVVLGGAAVAYVGQRLARLSSADPPAEATGAKMADAAQKFVETLTADQKAKAVFEFDSKERTNWNFVPLQDKNKKPPRKGLPLQDMDAKQKEAA